MTNTKLKFNKKGFTMIEIMGAIIIMGVLLLLIIPGVSKLMAKFRNSYYEKTELVVNEAGKTFYSDNKMYLPDQVLETSYVNVKTLVLQKYMDDLQDYKGSSCELEGQTSYVVVINKGNGEYIYQACMSCSDDDYVSDKNGTYCDDAWINGKTEYAYCNGLDDDSCSLSQIYFYYGTSREKIREGLMKKLSIVRKNSNGDVLDSAWIGDNEEEGVLPSNIDIIENEPKLDSENKKEYTMEYKLTTKDVQSNLEAVIYRHKAPTVAMKTSDDKEYTYGKWTNKNVEITLGKNDNFFELAGVKVLKYQYSNDGGETWHDIICGITSEGSCIYSISEQQDETYRFRIINTDSNISDETGDFNIKIDKTIPKIELAYEIKDNTTNGLYINKISYSASDGYGVLKSVDYVEKTTAQEPTSSDELNNIINNQYKEYSSLTKNKFAYFRARDEAGNVTPWYRYNIFIGANINLSSYDKVKIDSIGETYNLNIRKCNDYTCTATPSTLSTNEFTLSEYGTGYYKLIITEDNKIIDDIEKKVYLDNFGRNSSSTRSTKIDIAEDDGVVSTIEGYKVTSITSSKESNQLKITVSGSSYDSYSYCPSGTSKKKLEQKYSGASILGGPSGGYVCVSDEGGGQNEYAYVCDSKEDGTKNCYWHATRDESDYEQVQCSSNETKAYTCQYSLHLKSCSAYSNSSACVEGETIQTPCYGWCYQSMETDYYYRYTYGLVLNFKY